MNKPITGTRRDALLEIMGIQQFELHRPKALLGEVAITLPERIRLLAVIDDSAVSYEPLYFDILRSLGLQEEQVYFLSAEQVIMLPDTIQCAIWLIGEHALPEKITQAPVVITSPSLPELSATPQAKRHLWQQICHYEDYFPLNA